VRLRCRRQPGPRRTAWPLKQLLKMYAVCFLVVSVVVDVCCLLLWGDWDVFDEETIAVALGLAVLGAVLISVWGWFSFPRLGEVAAWSPPVTKRERLRGVLGLLKGAAVVGCVMGHIPAFVIIYAFIQALSGMWFPH